MTVASVAPEHGPAWQAGSRTRARERAALALVLSLLLVSVALLALTGNPAAALWPAPALACAWAVWKLPLRHTLLAYVGVALTTSIAVVLETWTPPAHVVYEFLSGNLNSLTGIEALRFSGAELVYMLLLGVVLLRYLMGERTDRVGRGPVPSALYLVLVVAFTAVLALELWGIARGGADVRQSLWQFRELLWLPVLTGVFCYALRGPRDIPAFTGTFTAAACIKIGIGIYFLVAVAIPQRERPPSMTGHEDSILFVTVAFITVAAWAHRPTVARFLNAAVIGGWVMLGLVLNQRRIAFVSLLASVFVLYLMLQGPVKRGITRVILCSLPVFAIYLMLGRHRDHGFFKPAAMIMSVAQQKDASSATRDIENYNLIQTLKPNIAMGTGWGHEYRELVKAYDIEKAFAQYRFVAHNSILWLLGIGGTLGFIALWLPVVAGVFFAARSYRFARDPLERTGAITIIAILIAYIVQAWGDMGTQGMMSELLVAWALAMSGKLACHTGAWPSGQRLFGRPGVRPFAIGQRS
ncbi:MAG TPA: O-antigen ligase family protein [Gemmatimonadaceae bacterium]|nr:O-antigen ligase family protein [Gemmatimonadaceae bacterium]